MLAFKPAAARPQASVALVTVTVMIGVIMAIIDSSIVNVALPTIAGNLGASVDEVAWVATGYILGNVLVMPLNGWLTARFGRKNYYLACFGLFTVASLLCGTATSVYTLIAYRIVQGLGGGALQPIAQAILFESVPPERRGEMMAIFGLGVMVGPAIGPTLGGYIIDNANWQMLFFFKIPLCIVAFAMAYFVLGATPKEEREEHDIDWFSFSAMAVGLASLQFVLSRGQREDWFSSSTITVLALATVVLLAYFIWQQLRAEHPFVNLRIFKSVQFSVGNVIGVISGFGLYGLNFVTPLFFQGPLGLSAYNTGIYLLPGSLATAASMIVAGEMNRRFDPRLVIASGLAMFALGAWWMGALTADSGFWDIFWPRILQGFALGLLFVPLTVVTLTGISVKNMSDATGISSVVRLLGGNIGIAVLQVIQVRHAALVQSVLSGAETLKNVQVAAQVHAHGLANTSRMIAGIIAANAGTISYLYLFRVSGIIFLLTIPFLLLVPRRTPSGSR
ncbi:MAG: transporter, family, multidrug resistance protein [Candidatus Eremiobacteraeota bacterium]|jgi:DHA2 family multidrug resistance protein|nr:transporter, family, multidrug resistance protein [Candidatus Eremiobacteraeota bacterium]